MFIILVPAGSKSSGSPGSLQRSRSDVDVNAAAGAKVRHSGQVGGAGRVTTGLTPGSYASLGRSHIKLMQFYQMLFTYEFAELIHVNIQALRSFLPHAIGTEVKNS